MGDRISISFKKGNEESIAFFSHWDGKSLLLACKDYLENLDQTIKETKGCFFTAFLDKEPKTIILDFIYFFLKNKERPIKNYYLGKNKNDGDNSDNGHFVLDLEKDAAQIEKFF